ncbi:SOS response-associated peptidase family protein [Paracoccus zeaxanthinifaciens]|uniref:SOS response-associated peptidase family protein n=1 Tax=Paracoccus zeaxanthinifaciens TaxID=187400 RepID=UPI001FE07915|nr:SOS response-associated peptidase family protein [Paracoccus zeaxanthinifaciens]
MVPLTSFAEPRGKGQGNQWFAADDGAQLFFAGIELRGWRSVRKVKDGETKDDLFAFLTCPPNREVAVVHPKAMPMILSTEAEWSAWLEGTPTTELRRPLPDGALKKI